MESRSRSEIATIVVDIIREVSRNIMGLGVVGITFYMFYQFVLISPPNERVEIIRMILVFLFGFATGVGTWYFGGAMQSAIKGLNTAKKEAMYEIASTQDSGFGSGSGLDVNGVRQPTEEKPAGVGVQEPVKRPNPIRPDNDSPGRSPRQGDDK